MPAVLTERDGHLLVVTLNRPERQNAINGEMLVLMFDAFRQADEDPDIRVVILTGAGGNFCAGGDFHEVQRLRPGGAEALAPLFENFGRACAAVETVDPPVVAVVEGVAMAGGFEFCEAADIVLVRDDARLCDNHVNYGQVPGGGGSQRLPFV